MKSSILLEGPQWLVGFLGPQEEGKKWFLWSWSAKTPENNSEERLSFCLTNGGSSSNEDD